MNSTGKLRTGYGIGHLVPVIGQETMVDGMVIFSRFVA
jgi:hypothetical protein